MQFQNFRLGQSVSPESSPPPHAPEISNPGSSEVLTLVKEALSDASNSDEERASEDEDVEEEDLVSLDEVPSEMLFTSSAYALIFVSSHEVLCLVGILSVLVV